MAQPLKTVAVLVATPALSSILSTTLAAAPSLRVRAFDSEAALAAYLQLLPAELLVTDFDSLASRADLLVARLRAQALCPPQVVALASAMAPEVRNAVNTSVIDEVLMKPMSPRYLVERVLARLVWSGPVLPRKPAPGRRDWSAFGDNIIPLFSPAPELRP